jgi:negative elongation factor C/D
LIHLLSSGYRGHAQMCNLLGEWIDAAASLDNKQTPSPPTTVVKSENNNSSSTSTAIATTTASTSATDVVQEHIKTLIVQKFDPKKADTVWGRKAAPEWLDFMISDPQWRALLYRLSADHKDCLLLNFAIQRISDAGHQSEIASLATASAYFRVFNRVLATALSEVADLHETQFAAATDQIALMADRTQHTFAYTVAVLRRLAMSDTPEVAVVAARIAREAELRAAQRTAATQLAMRLDGTTVYPNVHDSLALMLAANATNPSDIIKLYNAYGGGSATGAGGVGGVGGGGAIGGSVVGGVGGGGVGGESSAPVHLLAHSRLIELLANDLFNPAAARHLHAAHRHKYLHLLALATSGGVAGDASAGADTFARTRAALDSAQRLTSSGPIVAKEQRREARAVLHGAAVFPVGALCLLVWLNSVFADRHYFTVSYDADLLLSHCQLLDEIAERHPLLCNRVVDVLRLPIELSPGDDLEALVSLEVKRHALDSLSRVMLRGIYVLPVLAALRGWQLASTLDQSLVRRFIDTTIAVVQPPYSLEFLEAFVSVCTDERSLPSLRTSTTLAPLRQWVERCLKDGAGAAGQVAVLERLQIELSTSAAVLTKRKFAE